MRREQITVEAFTALNQSLSTYIDNALNVSSLVLNDLSSKADEIISLLIEQPIETMETLYYQTLTNLLNSYFDIVSSALFIAFSVASACQRVAVSTGCS
jgi:hypothetical protein